MQNKEVTSRMHRKKIKKIKLNQPTMNQSYCVTVILRGLMMGPHKNNNSKVEGEKCGEEAEPGQTERPHPIIFFKTEETKNCEEKRRSTDGETQNMD